MRDKVGDYNNDLEAVFNRLLILEEQQRVIMQRLLWLENPETVPKAQRKAPKTEPEGKL
ncbi:MAG: hypothetical protein H8E74_02070 [Gammaproteobacteria bacterium]|nr:hypothetical protein [Gammaproteobacteria bacterium]